MLNPQECIEYLKQCLHLDLQRKTENLKKLKSYPEYHAIKSDHKEKDRKKTYSRKTTRKPLKTTIQINPSQYSFKH